MSISGSHARSIYVYETAVSNATAGLNILRAKHEGVKAGFQTPWISALPDERFWYL